MDIPEPGAGRMEEAREAFARLIEIYPDLTLPD